MTVTTTTTWRCLGDGRAACTTTGTTDREAERHSRDQLHATVTTTVPSRQDSDRD